MKKFLLVMIIALLTFGAFGREDGEIAQAITFEPITPDKHHREVSRLVTKLLTRNHYERKNLNDSLSSIVFDEYLRRLDYNRMYFLAADVAQFEKHRFLMDDYLNSGQVEETFAIFNLYQQRFGQRLAFTFEQLEKGFDFSIDESIELDRENAAWVSTSSELDELWRKRLKYEALNLKLAGKEMPAIQETLTKRYQRSQKNLSQFNSEDVFQLVMNALAETFDPHTSYFSPKDFDDFKIRMSQSLEGIGARLINRNDYTTISEIVAGGPADKSKLLHPNDRIIGVGQGTDGEIVDVIGWRIDDVVQLIRGPKTTIVRLQVLPADEAPGTPPDTISLIRDKIKLEDQTAKSEVIEVDHEGQSMRFGVIEIPAFYSDFDGRRNNDPNYKSTTRDVRKFLKDFESKGIDGVIIDLRRNGGGFLNEAVDLTGLFIERGPVVQVRDTRGRLDVEADEDPAVVYDGPLVVMLDRLSASASEIFAAAIQDYNRGIIIGGQSFGKGTVQRPIDLNRLYPDPNLKLGQLKLTIAKFYRIDGHSTQHAGVTPDILLPSRFNHMEIGESNQANALLWDEIKPTRFRKWADFSTIIPMLDQAHQQRMANNSEYDKLLKEIEEIKARDKQTFVSLNESVRRSEIKDEKKPDNPEDEEEKKKDPALTETAHILGDYIQFTEKDAALLDRQKR